jgi:hypothetical protein
MKTEDNIEVNVPDIAANFRNLELDSMQPALETLGIEGFYQADEERFKAFLEKLYPAIDDWGIVWNLYEKDYVKGAKERVEDYFIEVLGDKEQAMVQSFYPFIIYVAKLGPDEARCISLLGDMAEVGFKGKQDLYDKLEYEVSEVLERYPAYVPESHVKETADGLEVWEDDSGGVAPSPVIVKGFDANVMRNIVASEIERGITHKEIMGHLKDMRCCIARLSPDDPTPNCFFCTKGLCWKADLIEYLSRDRYQEYVGYLDDEEPVDSEDEVKDDDDDSYEDQPWLQQMQDYDEDGFGWTGAY